MEQKEYEAVKASLKRELLGKLDCGQDFSDRQVQQMIDALLCGAGLAGKLEVAARRTMSRELFSSIRGLDVLQELLADEDVTEIMVNGPDRIFVEKDGRLMRWEGRFESMARLQDVIQQIAAG